MQRNGIVPKDSSGETKENAPDKDMIQNQLESKLSLRHRKNTLDAYNPDREEEREGDEHFLRLKGEFIESMVTKGFRYSDVEDFLNTKGLPELDEKLLLYALRNRETYQNELFTA